MKLLHLLRKKKEYILLTFDTKEIIGIDNLRKPPVKGDHYIIGKKVYEVIKVKDKKVFIKRDPNIKAL